MPEMEQTVFLYFVFISIVLKWSANFEKGKMFACDQCKYKTETNRMLEIHHNNMQKDIIYICKKCGMQGMWISGDYKGKCHSTSASGTLSKGISMQGMWIPGNYKWKSHTTPAISTWRKQYLCRECEYQAILKSSLTQHHQSVYERKNNTCRECNHLKTPK